MSRHRTARPFLVALAAAPLVVFLAVLLFSTSVGLAAPNAPASITQNATSRLDSFGGTAPASHVGAVKPIWRQPASHTHFALHRVPCAATSAVIAGVSCFAATTAG